MKVYGILFLLYCFSAFNYNYVHYLLDRSMHNIFGGQGQSSPAISSEGGRHFSTAMIFPLSLGHDTFARKPFHSILFTSLQQISLISLLEASFME